MGDCKVVFEELKNVPNGNAYSISNRGWHYNNGNSYHNYDKWKLGYSSDPEYALASAQNLIDAGTHDEQWLSRFISAFICFVLEPTASMPSRLVDVLSSHY